MKNIFIFALLAAVVGCGKPKNKTDLSAFSAPKPMSESIEYAISTLGSAADEVEDEPYADTLVNSSSIYSKAACTGRVGSQPCIDGVREILYDHCDLPANAGALNGGASLLYSSQSCGLSIPGDIVFVILEVSRTRLTGTTTTASTRRQDYRKKTYGGGVRFIKLAGNEFGMHIAGIHKKLESGVEISIRNVTQTVVTTGAGLLERNGRTLNGGLIEVANNSGRYTTLIIPHNLQYQASCCYPTAGSAELKFQGTVGGKGVVNFTGCGKANIVTDTADTEIEFHSCE